MGAFKLVGWGTRIVVLLVVTVLIPVASAGDPAAQPVRDLREQAEELAGEAQGQAQQAGEDAQRTADERKAQAEDEAERARAEAVDGVQHASADAKASAAAAEAFAVVVLDFGLTVIGNVADWVRGMADEVLGLVGDVTASVIGGPKRAPDGGFGAQSSDYALAGPDITAPLLWVAASVGLGIVLLYLVRRLLPFGVAPLLSRIAHSEIYNNDARRTIYELVTGDAGLCLNELVGRTGYSRNAVSYHLFVLEKEQEIVSVKDGKYRRYFARNGKYVNGAKNVVAVLRNATTLHLARAVQARPGSIQRDLCVELGATPSATCWHAKRLLELGVIRKERFANTVRYYPGEAMARYDLSDLGIVRVASPEPSPATP